MVYTPIVLFLFDSFRFGKCRRWKLLLLKGVHDEEGENVRIDFALKVVGQNKDDVESNQR